MPFLNTQNIIRYYKAQSVAGRYLERNKCVLRRLVLLGYYMMSTDKQLQINDGPHAEIIESPSTTFTKTSVLNACIYQ